MHKLRFKKTHFVLMPICKCIVCIVLCKCIVLCICIGKYVVLCKCIVLCICIVLKIVNRYYVIAW